VLVTLGHSGEIIEIDKNTKQLRVRLGWLDPMPHAISPYGRGWIVTNTLRGELWVLNRDFTLTEKFVTANLPGKVAEAGEHEWLQAVYPLSDTLFAGIDANRGLIVFDPTQREYAVVKCDENWCVQQVLVA
jgi:hypothetical protein